MLTGEMIHTAYWEASSGVEHRSWSQLGNAGRAYYTAMAARLNTAFVESAAAERDALHAQIAQMTETILRIEAERDAWQLLAGSYGIQTTTPVPTATMLMEQAIADFHTQMREMGIPFQEDDNG